MSCVQWKDLFNAVFFVIIKNFEIKVAQKVEVHLVSIVPNAHDTRTVFIEQDDLLVERMKLKFLAGDHEINLLKSISPINGRAKT